MSLLLVVQYQLSPSYESRRSATGRDMSNQRATWDHVIRTDQFTLIKRVVTWFYLANQCTASLWRYITWLTSGPITAYLYDVRSRGWSSPIRRLPLVIPTHISGPHYLCASNSTSRDPRRVVAFLAHDHVSITWCGSHFPGICLTKQHSTARYTEISPRSTSSLHVMRPSLSDCSLVHRDKSVSWGPSVPSGNLSFVFGNLCSFFHFIRRFWNQILICRSVRHSACAISIRRRRVR